jgi:hypothetical protein
MKYINGQWFTYVQAARTEYYVNFTTMKILSQRKLAKSANRLTYHQALAYKCITPLALQEAGLIK